MNSGVPRQMKGMRLEALETAQEAARRAGMSVGEWIDNVLLASAQNTDPIRGSLPDQEPSRAASPTPLNQAMLEIEARQRALDGEAVRPRVDLPRAPTQGLSDLEQQLRSINSRIETLTPCGIDRAVDVLRDDLAEIGVMLKDAMPRQAIEALESEMRSLGARIDSKRHAGADDAAIAGIERGLAEVRDALRGLTPAENLVGFDEAIQTLAHKIDRMSGASPDPAAMKQLEGAIVGLRGIVSHVASNDALANLSDEVRSLAAKVEHVANNDAFSNFERRIASLTEALESHHQPGPDDLEAFAQGLTDKIERLSLSRGDHTAVTHLEDRIVRLTEKLDASDTRLTHLGTIERALADLLVRFEQQQAPGAGSGSPDALTRDVQRTQDSLEAVHGTLGHVVDRLATIESSIRTGPLSNAANLPDAPSVAASRQVAPAIAAAPAPRPALAAVVPPPAQPQVPTPPQLPVPNPAPAAERRPIDPNLPPDHPLEPGVARGRGPVSPAERIAASEAALGMAKPPVIPDPGGKSNFIAAARRAAQAAIVEPPAVPGKKETRAEAKGEDAGGRGGGFLKERARALIVGAGALLILLGALHVVSNMLGASNTPSSPPPGAAAPTLGEPPAVTGASEPALPVPAAPANPEGRQSAILPGIPPAPESTPSIAVTQNSEPAADREPTGSVRSPVWQDATAAVAAPLPPPSPRRNNGADKLPASIGSGGLRAAAVKGDPAAEYEIALRYAEGRGVARNLSEAAAWFERAAKQGLIPAVFRLGGLYEKGLGVTKNLDTARRLYAMAAEAGNAKAMHNLAVLHAEGGGGKPDYQTASRWFRKAADHGVNDSQYNLGVLYARGIGVETNMAEAYKWFALASRSGDREATKKRDDVAGRLDRQSLAAAIQAARSWKALPQPEAAVQAGAPAGGWDGAPEPATVKR
ncbi:MAG: hypothetical protein ACRECO_19780, partial [Xanthobacteraceae bacterium]